MSLNFADISIVSEKYGRIGREETGLVRRYAENTFKRVIDIQSKSISISSYTIVD